MKIIVRIAQAELRYLMYTPIAWTVMIGYFLFASLKFCGPLLHFANIQDIEIANNPNWIGTGNSLSTTLFAYANNVISQNLYLFIPLLTMGAISREVAGGSMVLLSSSPIRSREIILGKFLGITGFTTLMNVGIAILLFTGYLVIENAEGAVFASIFLSIMLLSFTYSAIGLFISCVTNYEILAGIGTFVVFIILQKIGGFFQNYDIIRDITYFFSLEGRTVFMKSGLITTRDLLYFLLLILLFVGLSIIKMNAAYSAPKRRKVLARYVCLIVGVIIAGYFSSRPGAVGYLDVSRDKRNTIDSATQAVIKQLDGSRIEATLYVNLILPTIQYAMPIKRNIYVWEFWEKYLRFYPNIDLKYRYYYNNTPKTAKLMEMFYGKKPKEEVAAITAKMYKFDLSKAETPVMIDSTTNLVDESYYIVIGLKYKGKEVFLRTFADTYKWPSEYNLSGAIKELVEEKTPRVSFITGHFERSPYHNEYSGHGGRIADKGARFSLINLGVHSDTISVEKEIDSQKTDVLVIADPRKEYASIERRNILNYLDKGGNAIIFGEPDKQGLINDIINSLGVRLEEGVLVLPRQHVETDQFTASMTDAGNRMAREPVMQRYQMLGDRTAWAGFKGTGILSFDSSSPFIIEPIIALTLPKTNTTNTKLVHQDTLLRNFSVDVDKLNTDGYKDGSGKFPRPTPRKKIDSLSNAKKTVTVEFEDIWMETGLFVRDSAPPVFAPSGGDYKRNEYVLAVKLHRKIGDKEQRIVVAADADFMSAEMGNGGTIAQGLYSWLLNNEYPNYTKYSIPTDVRLTISKEGSVRIRYIYIYIIPGLLLLTGLILLVRRMRK